MIQWQFIGRLHPLVLHLPIGLVFGLLLIEAIAIFTPGDTQMWQRCRRGFAALFALSAVAAAGTGYLLSLESQSTGDTVRRHMWLGLAVVVLSLLLATLTSQSQASRSHARSFLRIAVLLGLLTTTSATGHYGGQLTHGPSFLSAYAPTWLQPLLGPEPVPQEATPVPMEPAATVYAGVIQPTFADHCSACHGSDRQRGRLALHTHEAISAGGASGPAMLPGNAQESVLMQRIRLPLEEAGHMPPAGKSQLAPSEVSALAWWIDQGASIDATLNTSEVPAELNELLPETGDQDTQTDDVAPPVMIEDELLQPLIDKQISIQRIEQTGQQLWIAFPAIADQVTDDTIQELLPLAPVIAWLDLSNTSITAQTLAIVARMPALVELDLRQTAITPDALRHLANHPNMERLNLSLTEMDDRIIETLLSMPRLKRLYLGGTQVTPAAIKRLSAPRIEVIGAALPSEVLEGEDSPDVNLPKLGG